MNSQQALRSIIVNLATPTRQCLRRRFHSATPLRARPSPKHKSVKAEDMGLVTARDKQPKTLAGERRRLPPIDGDSLANPETLKPYSEEDKRRLQKIYTPEQIASIEAGEEAIDPDDLADQAVMRNDTMGLEYFDDLSKINPVVDKPVRAPVENHDPDMRFKTEDEILDDYVEFFRKSQDEISKLDWQKFQDTQRLTAGKEEAELNPRMSLAPELPVIKGLPKGGKEEIEPGMRRLMLQTGYSKESIQKFRTKLLVSHRVVNQTRMGKKMRQYYLVIAGNGRGLLGIGEGKSSEPVDAMKMARWAAIRNMIPIPRYEERTIYGFVKGKVCGTEVELFSRTPGKRVTSVLQGLLIKSQVLVSDVRSIFTRCVNVQG